MGCVKKFIDTISDIPYWIKKGQKQSIEVIKVACFIVYVQSSVKKCSGIKMIKIRIVY